MHPSAFHPVVQEWFAERFGAPTDAQARGWPAIARGEDTLIAAPTGSGKTLAAFLWCIDRLLRRSMAEGPLPDETEVVYVSPLRALSHDVEKNLAGPLAELEARCAAKLLGVPGIRVAVRTGDTPASERQKAARRPPHILITTPESLYILLTAPRSRAALAAVKTVIVDEIHAVAGTKRGAHLALTLERLEAAARTRPTRIGLSATVKPIDEMARFLVGTDRAGRDGAPDCTIVDVVRKRRLDLAVEIPRGHALGAVASHEMWDSVHERIAELARAHRTTLVFANTRRQVERSAHALGQRLGDDQVAAHHGSLARDARHDAEQRLKHGKLRVIVATASLELGIDVGAVELVVQLGSPRSLSALVQRIGRAGHFLGGTPKGRIFAMTRDELIECAALARAIADGGLDRVRVRRAPLDVLAQQLVAECAAAEWDVDALFARCRRAWPYATLERKDFERVLDMLAQGVAGRRGRASAWLHLDEVNRRVKGRRGARIAAITAGGAIPDLADYPVLAEPEGVRVGTVDEDWAVESSRGDIFLLGNTSWRILRVEKGTVRVEDARGAPPTIPFWNGEAPGRSDEASAAVSTLRTEIEAKLVEKTGGETSDAIVDAALPEVSSWLADACFLDGDAARQATAYVTAGRAALGAVPSHSTLVAERFFDESGGMQLVLHAPFGARINRAWGLALRKRFCRSFNFELQAAATDDGIVISLGEQHSFPLESVFRFVGEAHIEHLLTQALLGAPMFPTRWRWTVTRALAVLRARAGARVPPPLQRMRADDLLAAVFPSQAACPENLPGGDVELPDHPLVMETVRDCLEEPMDLDGARDLVGRIGTGAVRLVARDLTAPSPFAEAILNANPYAYLDDAPLEERRTRAVMTRRQLSPSDAASLGALDADAIEAAVRDLWPSPRDADELHDALLGLVTIPSGDVEAHAPLFATLVAARRATSLRIVCDGAPTELWIAAERLRLARAAHPDGTLLPAIAPPPPREGAAADPGHDEAVLAIVRGWMEVVGPTTCAALARRLGLDAIAVVGAIGQLEAEGTVLRGRFTPGASATDVEWCDRRLLARIHGATLARLRREIAPVEPADLMRFLLAWQHVTPGTQLAGVAGVREVVGQLQGCELAAGAWESEVLGRRVAGYQPAWLDELCWRGEVVWGRFSPRAAPRPATREAGGDGARADGAAVPPDGERHRARRKRRPLVTRGAPVGVALRPDVGLFLDERPADPTPALDTALGTTARAVLAHLATRGASFLAEIAAACRRRPSEITRALGELVAAGRATGDSFAALRALVGDGERRREQRRYFARRFARARFHGGDGIGPGGASAVDEPPRPPIATSPDAMPPGRWSVLAPGVPMPEAARAEALAHQLLRRYGVVCRDLLARETRARWSELVPVLRRMEARGDIRGGRFVAGLVGEQFALPTAVEVLRQVRREARTGALVVLAATDPLNLVGILTPGARVPSVPGNRIVLRDGVPIAAREGGEVRARVALGEEEMASVVARLVGRRGKGGGAARAE